MSVTVIHSSTQKARKEYFDDGAEEVWEWIGGGCRVGTFRNPQKITFAEARITVKYRKDRGRLFKILPGDLYERQFNNYDGDTYTWRTKKDIYDLMCKYDLFPEI